MPPGSNRRVLTRRGEFNPKDWDGDPKKLPTDAVRRLRTDPEYAAAMFADRSEAFNAGLAIGAAVAAAHARRQHAQG
jgi:hypothetical protein